MLSHPTSLRAWIGLSVKPSSTTIKGRRQEEDVYCTNLCRSLGRGVRDLAATKTSVMDKSERAEHSVLISKYHALLKRIKSVENDPIFPTPATKVARKAVLRAELKALGGLEAYQAASRVGEQHGGGFDASQWVLKELPALRHGAPAPLRLLDVGAIVARFPESVPGSELCLQVRSIDLNSQHADVEEIDFFDLAAQCIARSECYDVVVLSLVLNFVPSAPLRGRMIQLSHGICAHGGLMFLVLPLASVANSRYCDVNHLHTVLKATGWRVLKESQSSKLFSLVCEKVPPSTEKELLDAARTRIVVRSGANRNNFSVVLPHITKAGRKSVTVNMRKRTLTFPALRLKKTNADGVSTTSNQRRRARRKAKQAKKTG
jgi:25S rRNA (adenine2142-N1)-methyltransferase